MSTTSKANNSKSGASVTMAELMAKHQTSFVKVSKGEILDGIITKLTSSEILVDIGAKTEALVLEKDKNILRSLLSSLKIGDKVTVSVLNPESDFGNPVVSLRRFNDGKVWEKLEEFQKTKTKLEVTINEYTKGGFLASTKDGISGFLPNSQISFSDGSQNTIGKNLDVCVIELSRPLRKVIFSQKATVDSGEFEKQAGEFKRGVKTEAVISNIAPFGIFTHLTLVSGVKVEGFVHISEVSWEKLASIPEEFKPGEKLTAEVLGIDKEAKRINLSIKRLTKNPFEEKLKEYTKDKKVSGTIVKILENGMIINLGEGLEGFIKKEKIPPTVSFKDGQAIEATVLEIDKRQRIILAPVLKEKPIGYR